MADEGLRNPGRSQGLFQEGPPPGEQHDFKFEFLGLVGLEDPVRPTVAGCSRIATAREFGMVMITGDYPDRQNIARKSGSPPWTRLSPERAGPDERCGAAGSGPDGEYLRPVMPEQKLRLVNALKANGEIRGQ